MAWPHNRRFLDDLIADYRSGKFDRSDNLLALLMAAKDPEIGYRYSDLEIRDELMTFLGASFETTAAALAWTWYLLSQSPEARQHLGCEVDDVLAGREPTADDLDQLPWSQAVLAESMRIYPSIMGVGRVAKSDDALGDYPITAGTNVAVLMHSIHHNERVWDNPDTFDPSRFLKENSNRNGAALRCPTARESGCASRPVSPTSKPRWWSPPWPNDSSSTSFRGSGCGGSSPSPAAPTGN